MRLLRLALLLLGTTSLGCGSAGGRNAASATDSDNRPLTPTDKGLNAFIVEKGGIPSLSGGPSSGPVSVPLQLDRMPTESPVKLDGVLAEWSARTPLSEVIRDSAGGRASMRVVLEYDDSSIFIGAEVIDAAFYRTKAFKSDEDHASLLLVFPTTGGGTSTYELGLFAGKPGDYSGVVKVLAGPNRGARVDGAKIVEAPTADGYTFEAQIPWHAIPDAKLVRVGLRGAVRYTDADASGQLRSIIATAKGDLTAPKELPSLPTASEQAVISQLLAQKDLSHTPPSFDLLADVAGDAMKERVAVYGSYLTICGPRFLDGTSFFYRVIDGDLEKLEVRDLTGRGKEDLVIQRKTDSGSATHEIVEVLSAIGNREPVVTFGHEIAITAPPNLRVGNSLHLASKQIDISIEPAQGWDASSFREMLAPEGEALLLPWGEVQSQSFRFDGTTFVKAHEVPREVAKASTSARGGAVAKVAARSEPASEPVPAGRDLSAELLTLYRRDRGVAASVQPRFDKRTQIAGDPQQERILLIGRDIVIMGPGIKGGTGYVYFTVTQFAEASDIHEVSVRDLTGDGSAEIVVRGAYTRKGEIGEPVVSELMLIYKLEKETISRVFAIETSREQGAKRVQGLVQFVPSAGGRGFDIDVRPGRAVGWSEKSYPWAQEVPNGAAVEPLLLPWGNIPSVRYSWAGDKFAR